jgi:hypothetical protein
VLVAPSSPSSSKGKKEPENARVLTSTDVQQEIEANEKKKQHDIKLKEEREQQRLTKKIKKKKNY